MSWWWKKRKRNTNWYFKSWRQVYHFIRWRLNRPKRWRFDMLYNRINKAYRKLDLSREYITAKEAEEVLQEPNYQPFRGFTRLKNTKIIRPLRGTPGDSSIRTYYPMEDIKDEILRRECVCWKDQAIYRKELYCQKRHKEMRKRNNRARYERVVLVFGGKQYTLGKFEHKLVPKLDRIIKEIYAHKDMFDPNNPNYISPNNLYYIGLKINSKNVDTLDPIQTLLDSPLKW